jgi:hypothetical protein
MQFIEHRRLQVDTEAQTSNGSCVVLRTRVRLTGDVQTDILRCWLDGTPRQSVEELANRHFRAVADATGGCPRSAHCSAWRLSSPSLLARLPASSLP